MPRDMQINLCACGCLMQVCNNLRQALTSPIPNELTDTPASRLHLAQLASRASQLETHNITLQQQVSATHQAARAGPPFYKLFPTFMPLSSLFEVEGCDVTNHYEILSCAPTASHIKKSSIFDVSLKYFTPQPRISRIHVTIEDHVHSLLLLCHLYDEFVEQIRVRYQVWGKQGT